MDFELQQAIYTALNNHTALTGLITSIYDHDPVDAAYPYVVIEDIKVSDWSTKTSDGGRADIEIHIWSDQEGKAEARTIGNQIRAALHRQSLALTGHELIALRFDNSFVLAEPDGKRQHGVWQFSALLQEQ